MATGENGVQSSEKMQEPKDFAIQEILDHKKDKDGNIEYKVKITQVVWVVENVVAPYTDLLQSFWTAQEIQKGEDKKALVEDNTKSKQAVEDKLVENNFPSTCVEKVDAVADGDVDGFVTNKCNGNDSITEAKTFETEVPVDAKVLTENKNVKKPGGKRNRKAPCTSTPWRSKRLKENDEKLSASSFYCKECKKSFRNEDIYTAHMLDHENIDDVVSRLNDSTGFRDSVSEDLFEIKLWDSTNRKEYKCRLCAHLFLDKRDAKSHQRIHDGTNPWYCAPCNRHFVRKEHYARHAEIHNKGIAKNHLYKCPVCVKCFDGLDALTRHRATTGCASAGGQLTCHLCQRLFHEQTLLDAHLAIHKVNSTFHCELCDQDFTTRPEYDVHMKQHDELSSPENCLTCGKQFLTKIEYALHAKAHEYDIYRCHACGETYNLLEDLEMHYQMSENCLDIVCTECNVEFASVEELRTHLQVCIVISSTSVAATDEQNEKIFVCRFCQRGYHLQTSFAEHMKIHYNAEKPSKCSSCNHVFDSDEKLAIHWKLVHDNEPKLPCVECGFLFTDETQLKKHVRAVHLQDKIFKCLPCARTFYLRVDFNKHLLNKQHLRKSIESGYLTDKSVEKVGKRLRCAICEKCFPTARELKRHEYLHQRIQTKPQPEKLLTASAELSQHVVDGATLPMYYNEAVYNFVEGEQVVLTTEDQASAFFTNTRIKIDESGNVGLVYVDKRNIEKSIPTAHPTVAEFAKILEPVTTQLQAQQPKPLLIPSQDTMPPKRGESTQQQQQMTSVSIQCDVTAAPIITKDVVAVDSQQHHRTTCDDVGDQGTTLTVEECSEETFLALSEMVKQGKIDISSLGMMDSSTASS